MISPATIERINEEADIVDVVGEFVTLRRAGANYKANCPFHNEKTPSFMVSPSKGIYKCFGCGKAGNSVKFIMEHEQLSFPEALRYLAEKLGIEIEETQLSEEQQKERSHRESLLVINQMARDEFVTNLWENETGKAVGLAYFKERGYREETIKKFQLGYSLRGPESLTQKALAEGYQLELLKEAGITIRKEGSTMDFFRERVMFPIHSIAGKVLGFGGRILRSHAKAPKYLNTSENELYSKSRILYGMYFAKSAIRKKEECILVEGYTDVITLNQAGIENVVASSGTSLTHGQARLIRRYSENVTVLFDGDKAGLKAALRGIDILLETGLHVRVALLPEGEDPDGFVKQHGAAGLEEFLAENRKDFLLFKADLLAGETAGDPVERSRAIRDMVESIALIPDGITRSLYTKQCANALDVAEEMLQIEVNKSRKKYLKDQRKEEQRRQEREHDTPPPGQDYSALEKPQTAWDQWKENTQAIQEKLEREVVRNLLEYGSNPWDEETAVWQFIDTQLKGHPLQSEVLQKMAALYLDKAKAEGPPEMAFFLNAEDDVLSTQAIDLLTAKHTLSENWHTKWGIHTPVPGEHYDEEVRMAIQRYQLFRLLMLSDENMTKIKAAEEAKDEEELLLCLTVQKKLKEHIDRLAQALGTVTVTQRNKER